MGLELASRPLFDKPTMGPTHVSNIHYHKFITPRTTHNYADDEHFQWILFTNVLR